MADLVRIALPSQLTRPDGCLVLWVIYERPRDFPDGYVLRAQFAGRDGVTVSPIAWYAKAPEELRSILPGDAVALGRDPSDDKAILEVWMG